MRVILPERIWYDKFWINMSDDRANPDNWALIPPICIEGSSFNVDDPFIQGGGSYNHKAVYHGKLPTTYVNVDEEALSNAAFKAGLVYRGTKCKILTSTQSPTRWSDFGPTDRYSEEEAVVYWPGINSFLVGKGSGSGRGNVWSGNSYWGGSATYYLYEDIKQITAEIFECHRYRASVDFPFVDHIDHRVLYGTTSERTAAYVPDRSDFKDYGVDRYWTFAVDPDSHLPDFTGNLFSEDQLIQGLPGWRNQYDFNWLVQHAFYDACQGIGKANDNSIQNILAIVGDIAGICETFGIGTLELAEDVGKPLIRKEKRKISKAINNLVNYDVSTVADQGSSAWLKYRYQYCTGKMDYEQYVRYVNHKMDTYMAFLDSRFKEIVHGTASKRVGNCLVKVHCSIAYRPRTYEGLKSCCRYVHDMGLELNPYVLWDMVPYSFAVDWFAPIGDVLDVMSNEYYLTEEFYDFSDVEFSISYEFMEEGVDKGRRYYRWYQRPPRLENDYWFDKGSTKPSGKLKLKRTLDAASLIVTRL